ncbi:hypothetical protein GNF10_09550 [Nostoc sp. UCD121]|nr:MULTISPECIES: hypothetical protein [unclassified Nostoc]MBC1220428.1 hypothetical protein [Nostoc sp. UCD120]MBC1276229.1 hypothetical protein [Nostoc sp. UCD121]MBC1299716.1 hypothetical protein [Nostoc sp. UCD122]
MKRNPTLPAYLCWVTRSLHPTYKTWDKPESPHVETRFIASKRLIR